MGGQGRGGKADSVETLRELAAQIDGESGNAELSWGPQVAELSKGFFFGEQSLMTNEPRSATCVAAVDTECFALDREGFADILSDVQDLLGKSTRDHGTAETPEALALAKHVNTYAVLLGAARREIVASGALLLEAGTDTGPGTSGGVPS